MCSCFMGVNLDVTATPQHIDNHKAYVQSWIQAIRDKPETLIRAIKDAQAAATYMDYKAGLITDKEDVLAALSAGALCVSTSDETLWSI